MGVGGGAVEAADVAKGRGRYSDLSGTVPVARALASMMCAGYRRR